MTARPLVSIVLPTYNRAALLPAAVRSCLEQTYPDIELILVDDGSSDETPVVCTRLAAADARVRCLRKPNSGISDSLNLGFAEARGQLLTWTSDDNRFYPQAIEKMVAFLDSHPAIGFVYADVRDVDAQGHPLRIRPCPEPDAVGDTCVARGCFLYTRAVMTATGPYDRRWPRCHDHDYWLRIARVSTLGHLPEVLYDYQVHEASVSGDHPAHVLESARLVSRYKNGLGPKRRVWATSFAEIARWEERRGRTGRGVFWALLATALAPKTVGAFVGTMRRAVYQGLPSPVQTTWRRLKAAMLGRSPGT